jgi:phosphopantothenoylcysteine decarboxylase/phosphopantothenate--cysteine ligase
LLLQGFVLSGLDAWVAEKTLTVWLLKNGYAVVGQKCFRAVVCNSINPFRGNALSESEIVIGVCGGVAAYKTASLVSYLVQRGVDVHVVMTASSLSFIGPASFTALTGRPPVMDLFDPRFPLGAHIELGRRTKLMCVAPATANFLSKAAQGLADDLLSTLYLSRTGPVLMAPAMNCEMWDKAAVQRNVEQLKRDGVQMIGPEQGWLSCRAQGVGRMTEPQTIADEILKILGLHS